VNDILAALDTSVGASLAIARDTAIVFSGSLPVTGRNSDAQLMPWVLKTLAGVDLTLSDVSRWIVGTGPGSFSGLRAGIAVVRGICAGSGARYRGMPTSAALAVTASADLGDGARIAVLHDGRRGQFILSAYGASSGDVVPVADPVVVPATELCASLREWDRLVTAQLDRVDALLTESAREKLVVAERIDASAFFRIADRGWPQTNAERDAGCEPVYVRPAVFVEPSPVRQVRSPA